mgnify:CR=1 FL=1
MTESLEKKVLQQLSNTDTNNIIYNGLVPHTPPTAKFTATKNNKTNTVSIVVKQVIDTAREAKEFKSDVAIFTNIGLKVTELCKLLANASTSTTKTAVASSSSAIISNE